MVAGSIFRRGEELRRYRGILVQRANVDAEGRTQSVESEVRGHIRTQPLVPFDRGLKETIDWYKANGSWIDGIRTKEYLSYYEKQYGKSA